MKDTVLRISDLSTYFYVSGGIVKAVDGIDLTIRENEIVTVVGESGSGKSVTAMSVMRLIKEPGKIIKGEILYKGMDLLKLSRKDMESVRGNHISMIFQNPYTSLHPYFKIGRQTTEFLSHRLMMGKNEAEEKTLEMFKQLGIDDPISVLNSYSFEISAGICQRVMLAIALLSKPKLLIADEPTTNLDSLTQIQILELIKLMREELKMSVLFITHDFGVVSKMADNVVVMYAGSQVESGPREEVLHNPKHPYSIGLIGSVPTTGKVAKRLFQIPGEVPDVMRLPPGCTFKNRCEKAKEICNKKPKIVTTNTDHPVRCWLFEN